MSFIQDMNEEQKQQRPRAKFPPIINTIDFLGEVREADCFHYPRNIGCSSLLDGVPLFLFGDTFEHQLKSMFVGVASSTVSLGSFAGSSFTRYPSSSPEGQRRSNAIQFIPFTRHEEEYNKRSMGETKSSSGRYFLWTFNAIIEIPDQPGVGVVWFIKGKTSSFRSNGDVFYGIGVAEVEMEQVGVIGAEFAEHVPVATRHGDVLFDNSGPQWGNVATILEGDYIYLYGTYHREHRCRSNARQRARNAAGFEDNPVFVCRVPYAEKSYLFPERYTYWDGGNFSASVSGSRDIHLEPVFFNIATGTIFHTTLFTSTREGLFVIVGCDGSGDGKVRFKIAEKPWGPWRGEGWLLDLGPENRGFEGAKSCVYAHIWASDLERGEIVLTWSEPWPGGVEMVRIGFEMVDSGDSGEEEEGQSDYSNEVDSMFSGVEERLMRTIGGQPPSQGEDVEDHSVNLTLDEKERIDARKRALAKLSGDIGGEDFQGYLDEYQAYKNKFDSGCSVEPGSLKIWSCDPFADEAADSALFNENSSNDQSTSLEAPCKGPFGDEAEGESEENSQTKEIRGVQPAGNGTRRLTSVFRETWYIEPARGISELGNPEGSSQHKDETSWYGNYDSNNDEEEDSRAMISDDLVDVETNFDTASVRRKHSFLHPLDMRTEYPTAEVTLEDGNQGNERESTTREPIPVTLGERRRRMRWGSGLRLDVSTVSKRNKGPVPRAMRAPVMARSSRASVASLDPDWVPIQQTALQRLRRDERHNYSYWQTHNRNARHLTTAAGGDTGASALVPGGMLGYTNGGYVTNPHETHIQSSHTPSADSNQTWDEKKELSEGGSQQQKTEGPIAILSERKSWLTVLKGGMQKLVQGNSKKQAGGDGRKTEGLRQGLKKKFSEMNLSKAGRAVVGLRRVGRSEGNLRKVAEVKSRESVRRFVEGQFDAGN